MKKIMTAALAVLLCGTALARPTYVFQPDWDAEINNDVNNPATGKPYTQTQVQTFLENVKNRGADESKAAQVLRACGQVQIKKGCHQASEPHITIWVDGRVKSNQVKACQKVDPDSAVHVNGCDAR